MKQGFLWVVLVLAGVMVPTLGFAQDAPTPPAEAPAEQTDVAVEAQVTTMATVDASAEQHVDQTSQTNTAAVVEEEEEEEGHSHRSWRGSYMWWEHSMSAYTLAPGGALTYNPTYSWNFRIVPRYYFRDDLYLTAREDIDVEITDSDSTTYGRQPLLSDIQLNLIKAKIVDVDGFTFGAGPRLVLPLSIASRAADVYFGVGGVVSANYAFENVMKGLMFSFDTIYTHYVAGSNVTGVAEAYPCQSPDARLPARLCDQTGGASSTSDLLFLGPTGVLTPIEHLNLSLSFFWVLRRGHDLGTTTVSTTSGPVVLEDGSLTHWRNSTFLFVSAGYDFNDWLTGSLNYYSYTPELNPNGSLRNPFFNFDTTISVTATVTLDKLYDAVFGPLPEDAENTQHASVGRIGGSL